MDFTVDVLLPFYVHGDLQLLKRAISSVYEQTLPARQLLVLINGGSEKDKTRCADELTNSIQQGHATEFRLVLCNCAAIAPALNIGIGLSNADWLARLDADDCMLPNRLQLMIAHLETCYQAGRPLPDVLGSAVTVLDPSGRSAKREIKRPLSDRAIRRYLYYGNPFLHPSVILRRSRLLQLGGYRPIPQAEDLDLWLRLARLSGVHFANLSEPLTLYNLTDDSLSRQHDSFLRSASCRLRHCDSLLSSVLFAPKILVDLLRYLRRVILQR